MLKAVLGDRDRQPQSAVPPIGANLIFCEIFGFAPCVLGVSGTALVTQIIFRTIPRVARRRNPHDAYKSCSDPTKNQLDDASARHVTSVIDVDVQ